MRANNVKLLTDAQFKAIEEKFNFYIENDKIAVTISNYNRKTLHDIDKTFHINALGIRKMHFTIDAINIWKELYDKDNPKQLLYIQHAVNKLLVTYQNATTENVKKILNISKA